MSLDAGQVMVGEVEGLRHGVLLPARDLLWLVFRLAG